ncbi:SRPBCC family protein [Streptomyces sp. B1I3]|uniref:SRPBCC family protein n=1 Tax=Streptomyces sp. B1I3 TaxID=3042264 RepID=UPI0027D8E513|nr:SRPBCC family protein [Streptomyces sp. B1I3]
MGAASAETVWQRYVRTAAWPLWAPQIRAVEAEAELRAGMRGRVVPVVGPRVAFVVEAVDHQARTWRWRVRAGPVRMRLWHAVRTRTPAATETELCIDGPTLVVVAYAPLARRALRRLVHD